MVNTSMVKTSKLNTKMVNTNKINTKKDSTSEKIEKKPSFLTEKFSEIKQIYFQDFLILIQVQSVKIHLELNPVLKI